MRELGFAVGKPTVVKETGAVALIGTMSSGRSIRFDVDLSGQMEFDMNGFLERKCADHLDEVLGLLRPTTTFSPALCNTIGKTQIRFQREAKASRRVETPERWEADKDERYGMDSNTATRSRIPALPDSLR